MHLDFALALRQAMNADFFFVQIGAFDGLLNDPLHRWVRAFHWDGLLVEPQAGHFEELCRNYEGEEGLRFRRVAVGARREMRTLWKVQHDDSIPDWAGMLASFDRDTILSHRDLVPEIESHLTAETIECVPLNDLLEETEAGHIDLLQIDVEGYDHELVMTLDLDRFAPSIVRFEHVHLSDEQLAECLDRLIEFGYRVAIERYDALAYRSQGVDLDAGPVPPEGPGSLQFVLDQALVSADSEGEHRRELERRLAAATAWTEEVAREAAAFRERSLREQREAFSAEIAEALERAAAAERRVAELESRASGSNG